MRYSGTIISICLTVNSLFSQQVLTLEQCREFALKNNIQAKNAELSVAIALEQKKEAFTNFFPSVQATGIGFAANRPIMSMEMDITAMMQPMMDVYSPAITWAMQNGAPIDPNALAALQNRKPQKIEMLKNGVFVGVQATQPVFAGGQIINGNRLAKTRVEVRQLQKKITENAILLETERCFWQLVSLDEKIKTVENSETLLVQILSDVKAAVSAGLTTRNDLLRVELEQNKLESGKLKLKNSLTMLKMVLGEKIGLPAESFEIEIPPVIGDFTGNPLNNGATSDKPEMGGAVQNRLEYRLLEKSVEAARLQSNMEVGKNLPKVAIGAGYNYMNFDMHREDGMKNNYGMVYANVSIPITDWWSGSHAIKRRKLELQQAENAKLESTQLMSQQRQSIQNGLTEAYSQILLAKKSILSAQENLKINRDNHNAGVTALSDLLEAQYLLQQARDQYTEAITSYFIKLAEWKQ